LGSLTDTVAGKRKKRHKKEGGGIQKYAGGLGGATKGKRSRREDQESAPKYDHGRFQREDQGSNGGGKKMKTTDPNIISLKKEDFRKKNRISHREAEARIGSSVLGQL